MERKSGRIRPREVLESHRSQSQQSRLELGRVSTVDSKARTIWIVDAHRDDGKRFIVHADEKLSAFAELERQVLTVTCYFESIRGGEQGP